MKEQLKIIQGDIISKKGGPEGRVGFVDLAKGFCILLVVLHHFEFELNIILPIDATYLLFFMPLFFLLSGMFFKKYSSGSSFILRKVNTLLIPFLFFYLTTSVFLPNFAHYVMGIPMERTADGLGWKSLYAFIWPEQYFNNPIWFLWCLFLMNLLFYACFKLSERFKKRYVYVLLMECLLIGVAGVIIGKHGINIGGNQDTAMSAMPFFCMGFILNRHTSILMSNKYDKYNVLLMLLFFAIAWACSLLGSVNYKNNEFDMPIILVYVSGITGTLGVLYLSKIFKRLPMISYWGRYSIMILVTHQPMIGFYKVLCSRLGISGYVELFLSLTLMMLSYLIIIPIMKRYLPHVTGQKNLIENK